MDYTTICNLNDQELYKAMNNHKMACGPVVDSTRQFYRNRLIRNLKVSAQMQYSNSGPGLVQKINSKDITTKINN